MFIAGRNSSWWIAGLSTYMTLFSAGTFVVWGGVAYRSGLVAVAIAMALGIASIFTGMLVAGRWNLLKINSPAEYLGIRFGKKTINFYTIIGLLGRGVHTAVALYAISVITVALIPLPEGNFFHDPTTGNMSVRSAMLILGAIAVIYTIAGGFLAVLVTDLVQFVVLIISVIIVIPLGFESVGGIENFVHNIPENFFSLVSAEYSFIWLVLWGFINFFTISGDWAFVQRYISVPTREDAKKSAYLVGALYLVTPILWYTPTFLYQTINPDANPEQAYILMSQHVLPSGMLGIMLAAMLSATLSVVDSTLNVFANVFTYDIYGEINPEASEDKLLLVGRLFTLFFGLCIIIIAISIPFMGGAERVVVSFLTLVIGPLTIPSVWGLFSKHIRETSVWISMGTTYVLGFFIKFILSNVELFENFWEGGRGMALFIQSNVEFVDAFIGLVVPVSILIIIEILSRKKGDDPGWEKTIQFIKANKAESSKNKDTGASSFTKFATKIILYTLISLGIIIGLLACINQEHNTVMLISSGVIFCLATLLKSFIVVKKNKRKKREQL